MPKVFSDPQREPGKLHVRDREFLKGFRGAEVLHAPKVENRRGDPASLPGFIIELNFIGGG